MLILNDGNGTSDGDGGIDVLAGLLGLGSDFAAGTGRIRLADGTTLANASCFCGFLELDNNIEVALGGTATIDGQGLDTILNGQLSGGNIRFVADSGQNSEGAGSVFYLNGANEYGHTIIGPNVAIVLLDGTLGIGNTSFDPTPSNPFTPSTLVFANTSDYDYGGAIFGNGLIEITPFDPATTITLSGSNTSGNNFTGTVTLTSGRLNIGGSFGDIDNHAAELIVDACSCNPEDAQLGGSGAFFGNVTVNNGTLAVGSSPGTLNIAGNLTLGAGTILNFELGEPGVVGNGVNDFVTVGGNLTLDGTLNILNFGPSYGPGYYALFRYGGTLTDNTLNLGSIDGGLSVSLLFNIPGQVNLRLGPQVIQYWDGADATGVAAGSGATGGNGGSGIWSIANTNWTAASGFGVNDQWRGTVAVFAGAAGGTITVDGTQAFQELRFQTDGYLLRPAGFGSALTTTGGFSIVQVDPGLTADIGVEIGGAAGLTKTGTGTLILSASNSYAGATNITAGTLRMGDGFVLPSMTAVTVAAGATLDLGAFNQQFGSLAGAGSVLGTGGFDTGGDNSSTTFSGTIDVGGFVSKRGTGNWTLTGVNSVLDLSLYDGTVTVAGPSVLNGDVTVYGFAGTPTLINDGTINGRLIAYGGNTDNNGTINGFIENRSTTFVNDGTIRGTGFYTLFNIFGGVFTNNGLIDGRVQNAEFGGGGTLNNFGTITGFLENVTGGVINSTGTINGTLNNYGTVNLAGQLNGAIVNQNNATVTLTGTTTGITSYNGQPGALFLDLANFDTSIESVTGEGEIRLGSAILTIGANDAFSAFSGIISGSGGLTKIGTNAAFLSGLNTYAGLTTVNAGALEVSAGGALAGDVINSATFRNFGVVGGFVDNNGDLTNDGTLNNGARNQGGGAVFNTTGIINPSLSGLALTNNAGGIVNARGQINGIIENTGTFNVTGLLTGITRMNGFPGSSFNLQGNDLALGGLGGSGDVNVGGATLTVGVGDLGSTFGGAINGSGGLTKVGNGLFTLSGQNLVAGTTLVSGGTMRVVGTGTIAGPVVNNATLENFATINGGLTNNGTYTQIGTLSGGLSNTGNASIRGALTGAVNNNGAAAIITLTGNTTGIGGVTQSGSALFDLNGFNAIFGSLAGTGEVRLGTALLFVGIDGSSSTFSGIITGSGANGLAKVGTGTLTLSGANTYTGTTTVTQGTLTISSTGRLSGNVVNNNATFNNDGRVELVVTNNGTGTNRGTIAGGVINNGNFDSSGIIETDVLNNAGATFFASGAINRFVDNRGTFNGQGVTGIQDFVQSATGVFNLTTASMAVGGLGGAGIINLAAHTLTVGGSNFSGDFSGVINGLGGLTKVGTGVLTLSGVNTYTGLTRVDDGVVVVASTGRLVGPVENNFILQNEGTITGQVVNNAGTTLNLGGTMSGGLVNFANFFSNGVVSGGVVNASNAEFQNQLNGAVDNRTGGVIRISAATTGIGRVDQSAGALFNLQGFNTSFGALAGAGEVRLGGAILGVGSDNSSTTFSGIVTGTGASGLTKVGTGTLTLSGANTYTGLTTVNAGTLSLTSTGRLALLLNNATAINAGIIGAVENRAGATFTNSGTVTGGVINAGTMSSTGIIGTGMNNSGTAQLRGQLNGFVNNTAGTITLTGALTGITVFTQSAGATLNLNGNSLSIGTLAGAGSILFGGAAAPAGGLEPAEELAVFAAAPAWLVAQDNAQPEAVAIAASATTSGAGTTETATASAGVSRFGLVPQDSAGPSETALASRAELIFGGAVTGGGESVAIAAVTGSAAATPPEAVLTGGGAIETLVAAPASVALAQPAESLLLPAALPAATGPILTVGSGNVSSVFAGVISGNGRLAKVGTGTLVLTGNNTYTDGTLISGGILQLGDGGTSGSIVGRIENNATLIVNRSDALTLSGIIDGTGLFVQAGTGTTTLTGANAYTGGTLITAGRLRGDTLSLQGQFQLNAGTLEFNQATTGTFAGQLFGAGAVEKTGAGLLTFTGDNSNLTGGTTVLGGELRVNGLLSRSRVTVGNSGTLSGTSIVGGLIAQSGGTVVPGAGGIGMLGVNGTIQFVAGSTFTPQVTVAAADLLLGNNTAQLAGTIAVAPTPGAYRFNSIYVLLQADGGRTGTFGTETGLGGFGQAYAPRIVYTPTQVQLLMAPNQLLAIAGPAGTPNQRSTLQRIDTAVAAGYDPQPLIALYNLTPQAAFLNGADQLSGEVYATSTRIALDDERLVREATFGRLRLTQDMRVGEGFGAWGHAVASWGSGSTDGNAARYERDQQGFVVGIDGGGLFDGGSWRVGLLGHHLTTDVTVDARGSNADIDRTGAGIYAGLELGGLRIRAGGTYSSLDLSGRRVAAFTGFSESLVGETDGEAIQGFAELAYRFQAGNSTWLEPYFQIAYAQVEFDGFSETGGASRLRVAAEDDNLTTAAFGLRGSTLVSLGGDTNMRLDGSLGGRHLSGDRMIFSLVSLEASPNQAFDIRSAAMDRFAVTGTLDATFDISRAVSLTVGYSGVIGADSRDHAARATLGIRF